MGAIHVHEFMSLDGVIDKPTWTFDYEFLPEMALGDDPEAIRRLKDEVHGDIYVGGCGTLVRAMLADGLVDELDLLVYPLTRRSGPRLFTEEAAPANLSLSPGSRNNSGPQTHVGLGSDQSRGYRGRQDLTRGGRKPVGVEPLSDVGGIRSVGARGNSESRRRSDGHLPLRATPTGDASS